MSHFEQGRVEYIFEQSGGGGGGRGEAEEGKEQVSRRQRGRRRTW